MSFVNCKKPNSIKNLISQRFGKLTVLKLNKVIKAGAQFECVCDCGTHKIVLAYNLVRGATKSCGCLVRKAPGVAAMNDLFHSYSSRNSARRKLEFNLSKELFFKLTSSNCTYCGIPPSQLVKRKNGNYCYNGLDRVDNNIGYIETNVVPCCKTCNKAKSTLSREEFLQWLDRIARFRSIQPENLKCLKFLITGTHGVGKSTFLFNLTSKLKQAYPKFNIEIIQENAREISRILNGEINTNKFQTLCVSDYLRQDSIKSEFAHILISDRTAFDAIIYGKYFNVEMSEALKNLAYSHLNTFQKIFFIRPNCNPVLMDDGFRMTDPKIMSEIDKEFEKELIPFKDKIVELQSKDIISFDIKKLNLHGTF